MSKDQSFFSILEKYSMVFAIRITLLMKNYGEVNSLIKTALGKWPNDISVLNIILNAYHQIKNWDAFYKIYVKLEEVHPNKTYIKRYLGTALISSYRYEDAVPRLNFCVENWNLDATYSGPLANTYARLAICYGYLGKWGLLEETLQKAASIVPWDPDVIYGYLLLYIGTNNSEKVQGFLDEQIKKYPKLYALYYWKAEYIKYYLHNIQESSQWYQAALERINVFELRKIYWTFFYSPQQYAAPWYILKRSIETYIQLNKPNKAMWLIYFSKLKILNSEINIGILRTYLDIMKKSYSIAEKKCRSMLKKKLSVEIAAEYSSLLALAEAKQGKLDDGLLSAKQALDLNSELYEAWETLGYIQMQKKDWSSSIQIYQKMINMNRFDFMSWENLGLCYVNINDLTSARTSYEQAIRLNPFEADAWIDLANIYAKLGNNDLAFSAYQSGLRYEWLDAEKRQQAYQAIEILKAN